MLIAAVCVFVFALYQLVMTLVPYYSGGKEYDEIKDLAITADGDGEGFSVDFDALLKLPGVGRKSANLIMGDVFGKPAIVTDTHCIRLVNRMGLVDGIKDPKKVEIARQLGLTDAVCGSIEEVREIVEKATSRAGCDVVFEASGAPVVFNQAMQLLKQNGRFGPVGRPVRDLTVSVKTYETILRRQLTIKGTWSFEFKRFPHNAWDISLEALQKGIDTDRRYNFSPFPASKDEGCS